MRAFEYASPKQKQQAVGLLGSRWGDTEVLAGGSDLLSLMKDDIVHPKRLVNIKDIADLHGVNASTPRGFRIVALTTLSEISENPSVRQQYPTLAAAAGEAASPQIRNVATLGGNLCQRPRCWYFRNGFGLLATGEDGKSLVLQGDNRYHAILGNDGPAYFVSPSTVAPVLVAYGAVVHIYGSKGFRQLPLEKFFVIPKSADEREHDLRPDEIIAEITLPPAPDVRSAHYEIRQKAAFDWPYATAVVVLKMSGSTVQSARVVLGHVAPTPWVSTEASAALVGKSISEDVADAAGQAAVANAKSLGHNRQKIKLARVAVKRAILQAAQGGQA